MYIFKQRLSAKCRSCESSQFPSILMTVVTDYSVHVIRSSSPGSALCVNRLKCRGGDHLCARRNCRQFQKKRGGAKTEEEDGTSRFARQVFCRTAAECQPMAERQLCGNCSLQLERLLHVRHCDAKTIISLFLFFFGRFTPIYLQTHNTTASKNMSVSSCGSLFGAAAF